ncbi:MAG: S41 family peptidase [Bacteroidota bacterium]
MQTFNFGFEDQSEEGRLSDGWRQWGAYPLSIDSLAHSGDKAAKITASDSGSSFGSIAYKIPAYYEGKSIRLEGFMKIKDVSGGHAGLLLRIDGNGGSLEFDNMQEQKVTGTKDWAKYSITLDYPTGAEDIYVAGILVGKGEAWFDDFVLTIDGKDVKDIEVVLPKAELDKEFDEGSSITIGKLSPAGLDNLELLGKVWGFLKYHHPEIAKGNYNWDYELFRFLPDYLAATDNAKRDQLLIKWIDALGPMEACENCKSIEENAYLKPDLKWMSALSGALASKIQAVYEDRHQGKKHYVRITPSIKNPEFLNEKSYAKMSYPDDGFRLLALYKYWNIIQYYFPYKHLMDEDWNAKLREHLPSFLDAKDELAYELAAVQIIGDVQDTHANLWGGGDKIQEWKGSNYPPVHTRFIEDKLVVVDYYNPEMESEVGLKVGDVITQINGTSVDQWVEEKTKYYPASNQASRLRDMSHDILRSNDNNLDIRYHRAGTEEMSTRLALHPKDSLNLYRWFKKRTEPSYKMLDGNIGYVSLQNIEEQDVPEIKEKFRNTKGIIIDIRNYPSTFVPFSLGSYFVSITMPFAKFTKGSMANPGEFTFVDQVEIQSDGNPYKGKLIVIVNELSQSQAEYTAMAFRAGDNTTVIGSTTAGADGNISRISLPGGLRTIISGIGVYYPNGKETQRVGIVPDVEVIPTIKGISEGRDELLEKAVEIIEKN